MNLGYGVEYERLILQDLLKKIYQKYQIFSVREFPQNGLLGREPIFPKPFFKSKKKPDFVWNFCAFEQTRDSRGFANKMADLTDKYALIITQNYFNPGVLIHWFFHLISGKKWDHGILSKMSGWSARQAFLKSGIWEVRKFGAFDVPWFILDVYETGKYFRNLPFFKSKIKKIKESRFENWPKWIKFFLAHHHYLLLEKIK